jgi:hypothetical protein
MLPFDYEGDGDLDVVFLSYLDDSSGFIGVLRNQGSAVGPEILRLADTRPGQLALSDLDGDGNPEVAVFGGYGVSVLKGRPGGLFADAAELIGRANSDRPVVGADWNQDGFGDLIYRAGDNVCVLYGQATLELKCEPLLLGTTEAPVIVDVFCVADLNGDGALDLAATERDSDQLYVGLQGPDGGFASVRHYAIEPVVYLILARDMNLDGRLDLCVRSGLSLLILHGLGDGNFGLGVELALPRGVQTRGMELADMTRDGLPDLLLGEPESERVSLRPQKDTQATFDCDGNGVLDTCELDCDLNGVADVCEILGDARLDKDANGLLDTCEPDCNKNRTPDAFDIAQGVSLDCDRDGTPDECQTRRELRFATPQHISIGETFFQIEGGDLDLDGDVDLVVGSSSEHLLRILRNDGARSWTVAQSLPVTDRFWHVQVVDLDGRTGKDILVTSDGAFVTLLNNGSGAYFVGDSLRVPWVRPEGVVMDLNLDGRPDIIVGPSELEPGGMRVFLGREEGGFSPLAPLLENAGGGEFKEVDVNGDGVTDIVKGGSLFLRDQNGKLSSAPSVQVGPEVCLDIDGDADLDFMSGGPFDTLHAARNLGGGTFGPVEMMSVPGGVAPSELFATVDLNGDHVSDLIGRGRDGGLVTLGGDFPRGLKSASWYDGYPGDIFVADLDGDGSPDVAMVDYYVNSATILYGSTGGSLSGVASYPLSCPFSCFSGDVNGDGRVDLIIPGAEGLAVQVGDGTGSFKMTSTIDAVIGIAPPGVLQDLDGDGDLDLAFIAYGSAPPLLEVALNDASGRFLNRGSFPLEGQNFRISAGRMDSDGLLDLVVGNEFELRFYLQTMAGDFVESPKTLSVTHGPFTVADLDGKLPDEIVVEHNNLGQSSLVVYTSQSLLDFEATTIAPIAMSPVTFEVVDLTEDGALDVLIMADPGVQIAANDGSGALLPPRTVVTGNLTRRGFADLDLDGHEDFVFGSAEEQGMSVLLGEGAGNFQEAISLDVRASSDPLMLADVDGDGKVDILFISSSSFVSFARNLSGPLEPDCNLNSLPDECDVRSGSSPDAGGDGLPDECQRLPFRRGDAGGDGPTNLTDAALVFAYCLTGGVTPNCLNAADANGDSRMDISDGIFLINYLFRQGPPPPSPGSWPTPCGTSTRLEARGFALGCEAYDTCDSR